MLRALLIAAAAVLLPAVAFASCGSDHCPIDLGLLWEHSLLTFDVSQQYLDQNQPRVGTRDALVGEIPAEENEVRTVNRITTARVSYQPSPRWSLMASLPYVSRYHEHIHDNAGTPVTERWNFTGVGDLEAVATRTFPNGPESGTGYHLTAGFKAPTGVRHVEEFDGNEPEPPVRPGNGAWAGIAGAGIQWSPEVAMLSGLKGTLPIRFSVLGRANGHGTERYRVGSELQANLGISYPLTRSIEALLSGDYRIRAKDDPGGTDAEAGHTGGTWGFVSPGLRVDVAGKTAFYGIVQLPVYQRVNGINLVSDFNLYLGVTRAAL